MELSPDFLTVLSIHFKAAPSFTICATKQDAAEAFHVGIEVAWHTITYAAHQKALLRQLAEV